MATRIKKAGYEETFIELIKSYPCIYDMRAENYRGNCRGTSIVKENAWKEIEDTLKGKGFPVESISQLQQRWKSLRDRFAKLWKESKSDSADSKSLPKWAHFQQMRFLKDYIKQRLPVLPIEQIVSHPRLIDSHAESSPSCPESLASSHSGSSSPTRHRDYDIDDGNDEIINDCEEIEIEPFFYEHSPEMSPVHKRRKKGEDLPDVIQRQEIDEEILACLSASRAALAKLTGKKSAVEKFADFVGSSLKDMDPETRKLKMQAISDIIFE